MTLRFTVSEHGATLEVTAETDFEKDLIKRCDVQFPHKEAMLFYQDQDFYSASREVPKSASILVNLKPTSKECEK